ncbi:glycosyltransferase family 4 protein [Fictibacillus sp. UD]|uniref:glycosyltransferase family 4 protein n=1 Tax=Fictibacillus sp. UD TaxID=3038777 RepID=UPI00374750DE
MRKKILFTSTIGLTIQSFLIPHLKFFLERGFDVGVATNATSDDLKDLEELGVTVHFIPFSRKPWHFDNIRAFLQLRKCMKHYDILHAHTPISSFLSRMASTRRQTTIYMSHGFHFNENGNWLTNFIYRCAEKLAGFKTSLIIVTNTEDLVAANELIPRHLIQYVPGVGVDLSHYSKGQLTTDQKQQFRQSLGIGEDRTILVHIAEFNANKRQIDSVLSILELRKTHPDVLLLLIGTGELMQDIQDVIHKEKLTEHVKCLGFRKDIPLLLEISDIGILLSLREGLPRSVMEMMCMELPVVATDIRGNRDLLLDGITGYLVPIKSPLVVAKRCRDLLENDNINEFGEQGLKRIQNHFSLEHVMDELDKIYKELKIYE